MQNCNRSIRFILHFLIALSLCVFSVSSVSLWLNLNVLRFALAQAQPIAAQFEFKRVAERRRAEAADFDAGRDSHFQQPAADLVGADDCERLGPTRRPQARPRRASCRFPRSHQHAQRVIVAEAKRAAVDADDARRAAANHFQSARRRADPSSSSRRTCSGEPTTCADFGDLAAAKRG